MSRVSLVQTANYCITNVKCALSVICMYFVCFLDTDALDDMGHRIDDLEKNIAELMTQSDGYAK